MADYYPDSDNEMPETKSDTGDKEPTGSEGQDSFLAPRSAFAGKEIAVGDEFIFRVEAVHGEEIELAYAPEKPKDEDYGDKPEMADAVKGMEEIASPAM